MQDESINYDQIDEIFENIESLDMIDVWKNSDVLYQSKENIIHLLEYINIILFVKLKQTNNLHYSNCISYVEQTKSRLSSNANFDMCIDNLLLKVWEEFHE